MAVWKCKACKTWGLGGPDGYNTHWKSFHKSTGKLGAQVQSFGFTPNYSGGTKHGRRTDQPVRLEWT